jgi:hypothetical protein
MTHPVDRAIGGYFGCEADRGAGGGLEHLAGAIAYESARQAIVAVLRAAGAKTVWVPHFTCGAVVDALAFAGAQIAPYALNADRSVPENLPISDADWVMCIDYFGLNAAACDATIARLGAHRVLVDASQALFHRPRAGASTVYSPRKFAGLPDGGLLVTPHAPPAPPPGLEEASRARTRHLDDRAQGRVTEGRAAFQAAEASLRACAPRSMSDTTARMLGAIDFARIGERRRANYARLLGALRNQGFRIPALPVDAVPLCCPVGDVDGGSLRAGLASRNIFSPTYWPDATVPADDPIGSALRHRTLYLPCDHRYGESDMARVVDALLDAKGAA